MRGQMMLQRSHLQGKLFSKDGGRHRGEGTARSGRTLQAEERREGCKSACGSGEGVRIGRNKNHSG